MPTYKRGLLPFNPEKHDRFKTAREYGFEWPTITYPIDKSGGITSFGMGGNGPDSTLTVNGGQPCGDCGPNAAPKNVDQTTAVIAAVNYTALTSNQIVTLYFTYQAIQAGISWRPPATDNWTPPSGLDVGVDLGDWLLWLYQNKHIEGFLRLSLDEMDAALQTFDAVVVGVILTPDADEQFPGTWTVGPGNEPDPSDGHAIQRLACESPTGTRKWATWGGVQMSTEAWEKDCVQQAFAVLTQQQAEGVGFPFAALDADMQALGGTVVPVTPTPSPTPTPPPPPESTIVTELKELVEDIEHIIHEL